MLFKKTLRTAIDLLYRTLITNPREKNWNAGMQHDVTFAGECGLGINVGIKTPHCALPFNS